MHSSEKVELSIVMPCLNEAQTIGFCIQEAKSFLQRSNTKGEIIIGDNGSTDGSQEIAKALGAQIVPVSEKGYGAALTKAIEAAQGKFIIMGDSDASYDFLNLEPFVEKLRQGYHLVVGNRFSGGIQKGAMPWKNRYIGNPVLSAIAILFFGGKIRDFHCGLRGFSKSAIAKLELRSAGMEYASEMIMRALMLKLRCTEVPTILRPDGRGRPPHLRPWRDGWRHLRLMLLYTPEWLFLVPSLLLLAIGGILFGLTLNANYTALGIHFGVGSLLVATFTIILGYQVLQFAIFMKLFGVEAKILPRPATYNDVFRYFNLERGILVGLAAFALGIFMLFQNVIKWSHHDFINLDPEQNMRATIPSLLLIILGLQTVGASFLFSFLSLIRRQDSKQ